MYLSASFQSPKVSLSFRTEQLDRVNPEVSDGFSREPGLLESRSLPKSANDVGGGERFFDDGGFDGDLGSTEQWTTDEGELATTHQKDFLKTNALAGIGDEPSELERRGGRDVGGMRR